jgi:hypothetical protein
MYEGEPLKTRITSAKYEAVMELYRRQHAERSEKTGVWGRIPQEYDDLLTGPSDLDVPDLRQYECHTKAPPGP